MKFDQLGLQAELLRALTARGYTVATPVQARAIPEILDGYDILAGAQTGTGKTAAFALPILDILSDDAGAPKHPRALILTPTRELADQVGESFRSYGKFLKLRTAVVYGGVGFEPQARQLRNGVDILVATPGRLLDHLGQRTVNLSHVEIFVLDEADRMLDMGFVPDIRRVVKVIPNERQTLFFSATYSREIRNLAQSMLHNPREIEVAPPNATADRIDQCVYRLPQSEKRALLSHLVADGNWSQVLVFTRTKHGANRLARQLEHDGITAAAIHGNKSQSARTRALADFKTGQVRVLVATDIASRGLDISQLPHVVNFELPNVPEDYVHRIGRTGRAGKEGTAISLVAPDEAAYLRDIEKLIGRKIDVEETPAYPQPKASPAPGANDRDDDRRDQGRGNHGRNGGRNSRGTNSSSRSNSRSSNGDRRDTRPRGNGNAYGSSSTSSSRTEHHHTQRAQPRDGQPAPRNDDRRNENAGPSRSRRRRRPAGNASR